MFTTFTYIDLVHNCSRNREVYLRWRKYWVTHRALFTTPKGLTVTGRACMRNTLTLTRCLKERLTYVRYPFTCVRPCRYLCRSTLAWCTGICCQTMESRRHCPLTQGHSVGNLTYQFLVVSTDFPFLFLDFEVLPMVGAALCKLRGRRYDTFNSGKTFPSTKYSSSILLTGSSVLISM